LVLISRELGVPDEEEGSDRWSLDHLFVDRHAMPTLVEVKRRTDTRLRREVVGQMLDYAAQGAAHWSVESLTRAFKESCEERRKAEADIGPDKDIDLDEFIKRVLHLGVDVGLDEFMEQVHANRPNVSPPKPGLPGPGNLLGSAETRPQEGRERGS
ncbi:MAG TPA: hypothetical protein VM487_10770, partial [Phycisphaerae bacterium]|nr:hypothetical protein [Phycisphaerae bacterium]